MPTIPGLDVKRLAIVSTYVPRPCGIATFSADLVAAIDQELLGNGEAFVLAIDDPSVSYAYPEQVRFHIRGDIQSDYRMAAGYISACQANVVAVQHEYGLFGGPAGAHILRSMRELRVPLITTLHTVLAEPGDEERRVMDELWRLSDRVVVMCHKAEAMLHEIYGVPTDRIAFIPHGIPDVPFVDPNYYKDQFGAEGRRVILTFGLLSPNKGIEYMLDAMPEIARACPDSLYLVLGATHPNLKRELGESYRMELQTRVAELGLEDHVRLINQFVELEELCQYIGCADVYVTPYLSEAQITSGTLAYALGAGRAVVSTPYWYAEEMLAGGRGRLVPFRDPAALADAVTELFRSETDRHQMRKRAYDFCRNMVWRQVAREYLLLADALLEERADKPRVRVVRRKRIARVEALPELDLRHFHELSDDTGILGQADMITPDRRAGYCLDDSALALIACGFHHRLYRTHEMNQAMGRHLAFLLDAYDESENNFRSQLSFRREWAKTTASDESAARALWSLGIVASAARQEKYRSTSASLLRKVMGQVAQFTSPRAWAFALLGVHACLEAHEGEALFRRMRDTLGERLLELFQTHGDDDWPWCETSLTYANAALPHALISIGGDLDNERMRDSGLRALRWLCRIQTAEGGHCSLIGDKGWYPKGGTKASFNQRPIDAMHTCLACCEAYRVSNEDNWLQNARFALEWFLGRNDLDVPMYDATTGGCCDSLTPDGPNANQGAEATLAWLIALTAFLIQAGRQTLQDELPEPVLVSERSQSPW